MYNLRVTRYCLDQHWLTMAAEKAEVLQSSLVASAGAHNTQRGVLKSILAFDSALIDIGFCR